MKTNLSFPLVSALAVVVVLTATPSGTFAANPEASRAALPSVYAAAVPIYPNLARMANAQGLVRVQVTTNGHEVTNTNIENKDAIPLLAKAAQENAKTWKFAAGEPITFTVTYHYILLPKMKDIKSNAPNSKVVLRFPTDVEVYAQRWPESSDIHVKLK
jgi:outer membrane biosynthesis protein TonB